MLTSVPYLYFQIHATVDNYYFGDLSYEAIDKRLVRINHDLEQHQLAIRVESSIFQKGTCSNYEESNIPFRHSSDSTGKNLQYLKK